MNGGYGWTVNWTYNVASFSSHLVAFLVSFSALKSFTSCSYAFNMTAAILLCIFPERCDKLDRWWYRAHLDSMIEVGWLGDRLNPIWRGVMMKFHVYADRVRILLWRSYLLFWFGK